MKAGIVAELRMAYPGFTLDVKLDLPNRGVSALFGPSGCGKTSTLRAVAGLARAQGSLRVGEASWQDDARGVFLPTHKRPLGYVFQEASLFEHLTVQANLAYGMKRVALAERQVSLDQAVELLGIGDLMDRKPGALSGGERQRVAMARALATSPRLLLLDEPLAALDARRKAEVLPYLERLHRELDIPVLYVSHAMDEVARLADTLVVMDKGRVIACGPIAQTLSRIDVPGALGEDPGVLIAGVMAERDMQWHLARMEFDGGSLWIRDPGLTEQQQVRVRVLARDVSLAVSQPSQSSIQNVLPCVVEAVAADRHPSQALVRVTCGDCVLLARVTARAVQQMQIAPGRKAWAQIKSVALVE